MRAAALGFKLERTVAKVLGGPAGKDMRAMSSMATKIARRYKALFDKLTNEKVPDYVADQILRMCRVPCLNYLSRVVPPGALQHTAKQFDKWTRSTFCEKHKILPDEMEEQTWNQLSLPMTNGGMGLKQHTVESKYEF